MFAVRERSIHKRAWHFPKTAAAESLPCKAVWRQSQKCVYNKTVLCSGLSKDLFAFSLFSLTLFVPFYLFLTFSFRPYVYFISLVRLSHQRISVSPSISSIWPPFTLLSLSFRFLIFLIAFAFYVFPNISHLPRISTLKGKFFADKNFSLNFSSSLTFCLRFIDFFLHV